MFCATLRTLVLGSFLIVMILMLVTGGLLSTYLKPGHGPFSRFPKVIGPTDVRPGGRRWYKREVALSVAAALLVLVFGAVEYFACGVR